MIKLLRSIRYYTGPWWRYRFIPKITIETNGFILHQIFFPDRKVELSEVISVFYRNTYSPENKIAPLVGYSFYEILTKDRTLFFYGEHESLAQLFDQKLEIETLYQQRAFGYFKRWKQANIQYRPVSYRDEISRDMGEKLAQWEIQSK